VNKRKGLAIIFTLLLLIFTACKDKEANNEVPDEPEVEEEQENEPVVNEEPEPEPEPKNTYPLTGLKTDEPVNNRIIGVMVNNYADARPQSGLSQADIVYEVLAEGPITRFLAFFHSETPEVVGPVRSAREYYGKLALGMDSIYIYHGAATHVEQKILSTGIDVLKGSIYDNDKFLFKREDFRVAPHNSYLIYPNAYEVAEKNGIEVEWEYEPYPFLGEEEVKQLQGQAANNIHIVYFEGQEEVTYEYDEVNEKYTRFNDGQKTVELETEDPILLDNIFIIETPHQVIDSANRRAIDLDSGGKGYLIRKGIVEEVEWKNVDGRILPFKNDEEVKFVPGKTWVNIVPSSPGISQSVQISE
jgi:hypothetical protein